MSISDYQHLSAVAKISVDLENLEAHLRQADTEAANDRFEIKRLTETNQAQSGEIRTLSRALSDFLERAHKAEAELLKLLQSAETPAVKQAAVWSDASAVNRTSGGAAANPGAQIDWSVPGGVQRDYRPV